MEASRAVGVFLMVTAAIVLVPIVLQLRAREQAWREIWGFILFAAGLFVVGASYAFLTGADQRHGAIGGLGAVLFGLLVQNAGDQTEERKGKT